MILDPAFAAECGRRARAVVHESYTAAVMARRTMAWYRNMAGRG